MSDERTRISQAVEDLRRKCDQLHAHLLDIELACAHKPQIKGLNAQQVPAEIEQAKVSEAKWQRANRTRLSGNRDAMNQIRSSRRNDSSVNIRFQLREPFTGKRASGN